MPFSRRHCSRLGLLAGLAAACRPLGAAAQTPRPITIEDAAGRLVTLPRPAQRVVLTFNFEEFTAIAGVEGWARVVGMSRYLWAGWRPAIFSRYEKVIPNLSAMPDVGSSDQGDLNAERILALRPDLVIMPAFTFKSADAVRRQLEAAGIPILVIDYNAQILARHLASTRAIGLAMGAGERGEELATLYEREMGEIQRRLVAVTGPRPRVYVELGQDGPTVVGNTYNGTMWGELIETLRGTNIAAGRIGGAWGPMAPEAVLAADPQLIFIAGSSWVGRNRAVRTGYEAEQAQLDRQLAGYLDRPGWARLSAIRSGQLYVIEHGLARSLSDFAAAQFIAKAMYPAAFANMDPVANLAAFHARYLPVPFEGVWMTRRSA